MTILAIDTSTACLAVALIKDGELIASKNYARQMKHAKHIVRIVASVLDEARVSITDLDCIACGVGPGSFTGLRIGHAFVKGMSVAHTIPLMPFSSMELLAQNIKKNHEKIAVVLDARRERFYVSVYKRNRSGLKTLTKDRLVCEKDLKDILSAHDDIAITGDALKRHRDLFSSMLAEELLYGEKLWRVSAKHMAPLLTQKKRKMITNPVALVPAYLRVTEAEEKLGERV